MLSPDLISEARIGCSLEIASKKRLLETLAELLASAAPALRSETVFTQLLERERLGSTGLGHGVALPHARMAALDQVTGAFVQTVTGVDYDAADDEPVDLAFALLVPQEANEQHLHLLAHLAGLFNDAEIRQRLRQANAPDEILAVLASR